MDKERKDAIAAKYVESPFLYYFVRSFLFSNLFRVGCLVGVLMPVLFVLTFFKSWRVSPPGFLPEVRVTWADQLKSKRLERGARRRVEAGEIESGMGGYVRAIKFNPMALDLVRSFLKLVPQRPVFDDLGVAALQQAEWLMKVSTNSPSDLELASNAYDLMGFDTFLAYNLSTSKLELTPQTKKIHLRALLSSGDLAEFDRKWRDYEGDSKFASDPLMQLLRQGYVAAFGNGAERALEAIRPSLTSGDNQVIANRTWLLVQERRRNADEYFKALDRLQAMRADRVSEHARGWALLDNLGRRREAIARAESFTTLPKNALDAVTLAMAYSQLDLKETARKFFEKATPKFGYFERLWIIQAKMLFENKDWEHVRIVALAMRTEPAVANKLLGFSYFLEARADLAENKRDVAEPKLDRCIAEGIPDVEAAFFAVYHLRAAGLIEYSRKLMLKSEDALKDLPGYYQFKFELADQLKDPAMILDSAHVQFERAPDDLAAINNYAAALLINHTNLDQAVALTMKLTLMHPDLNAVKLNHAQALFDNDRVDECLQWLGKVDLLNITAPEKTAYHFIEMDLLTKRKQFKAASAHISGIDPKELFTTQRDRFQVITNQIQDALNAELQKAAAGKSPAKS